MFNLLKIKIFAVFLRGALTSKVYSFSFRPWELKKLICYDLFDSFLTKMTCEITQAKIIRISPRLENGFRSLNIISDKARFFFDCLTTNRTLKAFVQSSLKFIRGNSSTLSFLMLFFILLKLKLIILIRVLKLELSILKLKKKFVFKTFSSTFDFNTVLSPKTVLVYLNLLASSGIQFQTLFSRKFYSESNSNYNDLSLILRIESLQKCSTSILLCGLEPRFECPTFNASLRNKFIKDNCGFFSFGPHIFSTFKILNLGFTIRKFIKFLNFSNFLNLIASKSKIFVSHFIYLNFSHFISSLSKIKIVLSDTSLFNKDLLKISFGMRSNFCLFSKMNLKDLSFIFKVSCSIFEPVQKLSSFINKIKINSFFSILFSSHSYKSKLFFLQFTIFFPIRCAFETTEEYFDHFGSLRKTTNLLSTIKSYGFVSYIYLLIFSLQKLSFSTLNSLVLIFHGEVILKPFSLLIITEFFHLKILKFSLYNKILNNFYMTDFILTYSLNLNSHLNSLIFYINNYKFCL